MQYFTNNISIAFEFCMHLHKILFFQVFHYAIELFEGLKAYKGIDGKIRLFRPDMNMQRMRRTAERASLPVCLKFFSMHLTFYFFT